MYGPLVMCARFEQEARDKWYRHFASDEKQEVAPNLQLKGKPHEPSSWLEPSGGRLAFRTVGQSQSTTFVPLSTIVHERYAVYHEVKESNS
jgi:hypothetical protein